MTSLKLVIATISIGIVSAIPVDPGAQLFTQGGNHGEYKEVTLYLTPSQIKAFEASQGQNTNYDQRNQVSEQELKILEAEIKRQLEGHHFYTQDQHYNEKAPANYQYQPSPVEEPIQEDPLEYSPQYQQKWQPIPQQQADHKDLFHPTEHHQQITGIPQSYSYIKFYTDKDVHETPKLQFFHPVPYEHKFDPELAKFPEIQRDPLHHKQYRLIPYEYDTTPEPPKYSQQSFNIPLWSAISEKYNNNQNIALPQSHQLSESLNDQKENIQHHQENLSDLKYAPQFDDHKHSVDDQNFQIKIEKENALARAEAIFKSTPEKEHKEINPRRPVPSIKHLNRPSAPYYVKNKTNYFDRFRSLDVKKYAPSETLGEKTGKTTILYPVRKP